jgi:hypothetical protein
MLHTYIKVLEGFFTSCHELLLLMQVTELDIRFKMFVLVDRSLVASSAEVIVPAVIVFWEVVCWRKAQEGYAANSPPVTVHQVQGVSAAKVRVTHEPNYGVCCWEIDSIVLYCLLSSSNPYR